MHDHIRKIERNKLFADVPPDRLANLQRACRVDRRAKGSPIYMPVDPSDAVFVVATGRVRICHLTQDGKRSTLAYIDPEEVFGELAVLGQSPREEYAEAAKDTAFVQIPADPLRTLVHELPLLGVRFLHLIGSRRKRVENRMRNLLFSPSRDRLIYLLLELSDKYGVPAEEGVRLTTDLSHQDLASMIGATRETVTLVLGELQTQGLIKLGRRKITLVRPEAITELVRRLPGSTAPPVFGDAPLAESSAG